MQNNEVPHIASYETHQRSQEISIVTPKRLLQQYLPIAEMATLGLATQGIDAREANALPPYLNSVAVNDGALVRSDH